MPGPDLTPSKGRRVIGIFIIAFIAVVIAAVWFAKTQLSPGRRTPPPHSPSPPDR